jgi:hypothetical protein
LIQEKDKNEQRIDCKKIESSLEQMGEWVHDMISQVEARLDKLESVKDERHAV